MVEDKGEKGGGGPADGPGVRERAMARTVRRIRSVKVAAINCFIMPAPLKIPSAISLVEMMK